MNEQQANAIVNLLASIEKKITAIAEKLSQDKKKGK